MQFVEEWEGDYFMQQDQIENHTSVRQIFSQFLASRRPESQMIVSNKKHLRKNSTICASDANRKASTTPL